MTGQVLPPLAEVDGETLKKPTRYNKVGTGRRRKDERIFEQRQCWEDSHPLVRCDGLVPESSEQCVLVAGHLGSCGGDARWFKLWSEWTSG